MDNADAATEYEIALARTEGAEDPWPAFWEQMDGEQPLPRDEQLIQIAAELLRVAVGDILSACGGDPKRTHMLLCRLAGRSYGEIARDTGTSRQAVFKHLLALERTRPEISTVLRPTYRRTVD